MYVVRDIKSLAGKAPSEVFHQMGDYQRWSLSSPATAYQFPETDSGFLANSSEAAKEPRSGASRQAPAVKTFLFVLQAQVLMWTRVRRRISVLSELWATQK